MIWSCGAHLGDVLWSLIFLRRIGGEQQFYCKAEYVPDCKELMNDTQVYVGPLEEWDGSGPDCWIANAMYEPEGIVWQCQQDIMGYVFDYFNAAGMRHVGRKAFEKREDMLWDSMAIVDALATVPHPDILIINSDPLSGQCPSYSRDQMNELIVAMMHRWEVVATTVAHRPNYTLAQIGAMSITAKFVIAVANGPHWPTWNRWCRANRLIVLDPMKLDFHDNAKVTHFANVPDIMAYMKKLT